jgi:hypothetical protein
MNNKVFVVRVQSKKIPSKRQLKQMIRKLRSKETVKQTASQAVQQSSYAVKLSRCNGCEHNCPIIVSSPSMESKVQKICELCAWYNAKAR